LGTINRKPDLAADAIAQLLGTTNRESDSIADDIPDCIPDGKAH